MINMHRNNFKCLNLRRLCLKSGKDFMEVPRLEMCKLMIRKEFHYLFPAFLLQIQLYFQMQKLKFTFCKWCV